MASPSTTKFGPLHGVRVWLSGAIPEDVPNENRESILKFIRGFAGVIFEDGGHIVHGSHPSFTPVLLELAKRHIENGGRKDCLTLAVSRFWSKNSDALPLNEWRQICMVYETPEDTGSNARENSLLILRQWMADRCDVFVALGGMWWTQLRAGVPIEAGLAIDRGLPCFLLGGLGGAARDFLMNNPEIIKKLKNGLNLETNQRIASEQDVGSLVDEIRSQLHQLPLVRGRVVDGITFRILALDGGGIKGAFTASVLATLEGTLNCKVSDYFDLIAGTSTGGILAIGLGMGLDLNELLKFYRERGSIIFPITSFHNKWWRKIWHFFHPKYSQKVLYRELKAAYFKNSLSRTLGSSKCRLVIPAYDAIGGKCHVFRTPHNPLQTADGSVDAAAIAVATAAAPTYFAGAQVSNLISNATYFDGGVWANSPAMAAIIEAVCYLDVPIDRIDVLSIGTTEEPFTVRRMHRSGILGWGLKLIDLLMHAQTDSSIDHAESLVGSPRFLRINTVTVPGIYTLDGSKELEELIALGHSAGNKTTILDQIKSRFMNGVPSIPWK